MKNLYQKSGFTLIEVLVVIAIIGILSAALFVNFEDARKQARDKARMASLKELQLSIEFYKAQNGVYPEACAAADYNSDDFAGPGAESSADLVTCATYITGLVPDFISVLPTDPKFESDNNKGFYYRSDGDSYKLMSLDTVESLTVTSYGDEFARCPAAGGGCAALAVPANTYAVYSAGAESW
jgi:prepilin-type N-terminal cleavage/methylation domain-containing protein